MIGVGATLNQRFTLDKELGQGGMGTVYRATDQWLRRNVAVKLLKDAGTDVEAKRIPPRGPGPRQAGSRQDRAAIRLR